MAAPKSQKKTPDLREKAVKSALTLAARDGWDNVSLNDIARHAKISLSDLHDHFEDRTDILVAYGRITDRKVLESVGEVDESSSHRDRLFEILMERFDVLNDDRDALLSILDSFKFDPKQLVIGLPHLGRSMSWMLEAAGIETTGIRGAANLLAITTVYVATVKTWMEDESEDMSKTMAALDKNLSRAEQLAGMVGIKD
jgi:AcrR family transcriptional regulator